MEFGPRHTEPVPVSGCGCLCAAGKTLTETMETLFAGRRGWISCDQIASMHPIKYPVFPIPPESEPQGYRDAPECERCGRLAIAAVEEALSDANLSLETLQGRRVGVCLGTTVGSAMNNEGFYRDFRLGKYPDIEPIRGFLQANPASMVTRAFQFSGPCMTVVNACSSGTVAIGQAYEWIRLGLCDVVLAGGTDMLCRVVYNGFISLKIADELPCRPFDRDRRGLNLGEGAGIVVLENRTFSENRNRAPRAYLRGYGNTCDAYHPSAPHPQAKGLARAFDSALAQAGIQDHELAFINAHGTGTHENDAAEGYLFSSRFKGVPFCSTKGYTGHALGAAGGIEAAITVACLNAGKIPGNAGLSTPDPTWEAVPVSQTTEVYGRYALSDNAAFGGNNGAIVFEKGDR